MAITQLNPLEAHALLVEEAKATYIDVRAVAEFAVNHPRAKQIMNIPSVFFHPTTKETHANENFLLVLNDVCDKNARLVIGADDGERAGDAAKLIEQDGFTDVAVMPQGVGGWINFKLPTTADNRPGISYVSLLTKAKRRKS